MERLDRDPTLFFGLGTGWSALFAGTSSLETAKQDWWVYVIAGATGALVCWLVVRSSFAVLESRPDRVILPATARLLAKALAIAVWSFLSVTGVVQLFHGDPEFAAVVLVLLLGYIGLMSYQYRSSTR